MIELKRRNVLVIRGNPFVISENSFVFYGMLPGQAYLILPSRTDRIWIKDDGDMMLDSDLFFNTQCPQPVAMVNKQTVSGVLCVCSTHRNVNRVAAVKAVLRY